MSLETAQANEAWEDLLARVATRDERTFDRLYEESNPFVFGLVLRMVGQRADAEEVSFDIYQQIWAQAGRFDWDGALRFLSPSFLKLPWRL